MAVIINGLSQCDSCGPLKIGLNNKILAHGNFFSPPAPSFPLPHSGLVMHANVSSLFPPSHTLSSSGQARIPLFRGRQVGNDPAGSLLCTWHWAKCLTGVTSVISAHLSPDTVLQGPLPLLSQDLHLSFPPTSRGAPSQLLCLP